MILSTGSVEIDLLHKLAGVCRKIPPLSHHKLAGVAELADA